MTTLLNLTAADKKFIDDITRLVTAKWTPDEDMTQNQQIEFEGSDDDIRSKFEVYLTQLLTSVQNEEIPSEADGTSIFTD
jgi:phosphorylcholine metabolism protein LicD